MLSSSVSQARTLQQKPWPAPPPPPPLHRPGGERVAAGPAQQPTAGPCPRGSACLLAAGGFQTLFPSLLSTSPPQGFLGALHHPRTMACPESPQCHLGPALCALSAGGCRPVPLPCRSCRFCGRYFTQAGWRPPLSGADPWWPHLSWCGPMPSLHARVHERSLPEQH